MKEMLAKKSWNIVNSLCVAQKLTLLVFFLKFATRGNIRPHILQIKLCRIHFGPISDKICGQIRLSGKNLDTKIISVLGGQEIPLTFTLHCCCLLLWGGEKKVQQFPAKLSSCLFESFQFSDFLWISCPQLHCKCPQASEKQRWCFGCGNMALRGA